MIFCSGVRRRKLLLLELTILELYTIMHQVQAPTKGEDQCSHTSRPPVYWITSCIQQTKAGYEDGGNSLSEPEEDNRRHSSIVECVQSSCLIIKTGLEWRVLTVHVVTAVLFVRTCGRVETSFAACRPRVKSIELFPEKVLANQNDKTSR